MRFFIHLSHLFLLLLLLLTIVYARTPSSWSSLITPRTAINTSHMVDRSASVLVAGSANNTPNLNDIIGTCKNQQGGIVPKAECQRSVLSVGVGMGLAALSYRSTNYWAGAFGPNGNNKRALEATDDFFSRLPDHLSISNIKIQGTSLPVSPRSRSIHLQRRNAGADEINVFYNGSLPLTFMVHRQTRSTNETEQHSVPMFAATDGSRMWLTHVRPLAHLTITSDTGIVEARSGYDGYNHVGAGGIKLLGNSDPVATWNDTTAWLNTATEDGGYSPFDYVSAMANVGTVVGHSLISNVHDERGWGYNAQFAMEGYDHAFSPDWEEDFNWCFGAYPTNC
ncbi:hypothetical protein BUE80_DR008005 [Diplocarpon rosae]|nr:hypothetical protein BUE80_DR008005 [Diplocarpon rosae]